MNPTVHILARAVIEHERHFLLAHELGVSNTFLPGGHVEPGEGLVSCLRRELKEELGLDVAIGDYLGAVEHSWCDDHGANYEINHCFEVSSEHLSHASQVTSCEPHLEFIWVHESELDDYELMPEPFREILANWKRGGKGVWWASTLSE